MTRGMWYVVGAVALAFYLVVRGWSASYSDAKEQRGRADKAVSELARAKAAQTSWRDLHAKANTALTECVSNWNQAQRAGVAAAQDALAARRELQVAKDEFQRRWAERSSGCGTSLIAMRDACAADIGAF